MTSSLAVAAPTKPPRSFARGMMWHGSHYAVSCTARWAKARPSTWRNECLGFRCTGTRATGDLSRRKLEEPDHVCFRLLMAGGTECHSFHDAVLLRSSVSCVPCYSSRHSLRVKNAEGVEFIRCLLSSRPLSYRYTLSTVLFFCLPEKFFCGD